jgi:hypothetical protein
MLAQTVRVAIDEAEAERRIRETFDQVEVWHRAPLFTPLLGAQLRADDDEWPHLALSQLAKAGLDVAAEHLFTIRTLVEAGQVLPIAFRSILRTALVGSTQAVWLLESDDLEERTRRHRVLVNEMYRRHGAYLKALLKSDDHSDVVAHENTIKLHTHITKRHSQIGTLRTFADETQQAARAAFIKDPNVTTWTRMATVRERHSQIGTLRTFADETETWEDTRAIEQAARAAFIKDPNVDQLVLEARLEWMAGSGAAHGLVWPLFGTAGTRVLGPADKQGRAVIEAGGSYARVLNAYLLAYWMTAAGWKLLRRRGL